MKQILGIFLSMMLVCSMAGCRTKEAIVEPEEETYIFIDDSGREVELPVDITRIAPTGAVAQIVLYTLCPEKMVGWATEFSDSQKEYLPAEFTDLPIFGSFYADTLNLEAVMLEAPQVIVDIGEPKSGIAEDLDGIQEKTGIPTIFIEMDLSTMADAYEQLGNITGCTEQGNALATYVSATLAETEALQPTIPDDQRKTVYYAQGEGLSCMVAGTIHADVIDAIGAINVAQVEDSLSGGACEIDFEQLLLWNPQVMVFSPDADLEGILSQERFQSLEAIAQGSYVTIPSDPYNWMGRPPSVNRILGMKWLGNLIYPDVFDYDMVEETKVFYDLFYHCTLTDNQATALLQ